MCTAASYRTKDLYFGRNLDYEFSYGDEVTITPRNYPFTFRRAGEMRTHYAMIGMAYVAEEYPLYYDAVNEKGLCIAGLNFVGNAACQSETDGKDNISVFELIPWLLGQCADLNEVRALLAKLNLVDIPFNAQLPTAKLHWLITDRTGSITVEAVADGLHVYENPVEVLTNNPPFPMQLFALNNYAQLSPEPPVNRFAPDLPLETYSRGMGAMGLPGDLSSQSRFVRAAFVRANSVSGDGEAESLSQLFHILGSVEQQRGCCRLAGGECELTLYTGCCNADRGVYYYTTYDNGQITAVDMHRADLDGDAPVSYPLVTEMQVRWEN